MRCLASALVMISAILLSSGPVGPRAMADPIPLSQFSGAAINNVNYGPIVFSAASGIDPSIVTVDTTGGALTLAFNGQADGPEGVSRRLDFTETATALSGYTLTLASASLSGSTSGRLSGPGISYSENPIPAPGFAFDAHSLNFSYGGSGVSAYSAGAPTFNVSSSIFLKPAGSGGTVSLATLRLGYGARPVPEPSALLLTAVGLVALLAYGSRFGRVRTPSAGTP